MLTAHDVDFVLIGGVAARLHGSPTVTRGLDVCYGLADDNLDRLAAALMELGATLRGVDDHVPFRLDAGTLKAGGNFSFNTRYGALDILAFPSGVNGYDDLIADADRVDFGEGITVAVTDIEDLIRMKTAAGRAKDRAELEILHAATAEREA